jgi:annexin A7/11
MKGFGTDEAALISILTRVDPIQMAALRTQYQQRFGRSLLTDIEKETSGYFEMGLIAIVRGPLEQDVTLLNRAMAGAGTKEVFLNDVLLGRSNADLNAIKNEYRRLYHKPLETVVRGELSLKTEKLFDMVLEARRAEESAPVVPQEIDRDVADLDRAMRGIGADQITVSNIIAHRSDAQLRAIAQSFEQRHRRTLISTLKKEFSGHMEDAFVLMVGRAVDRPKADAELLHAAMKGAGTKDEQLVTRMVAFHWNRQHMQQVVAAYRHHFGKDLASVIRSETSGDYEKLMVALTL